MARVMLINPPSKGMLYEPGVKGNVSDNSQLVSDVYVNHGLLFIATIFKCNSIDVTIEDINNVVSKKGYHHDYFIKYIETELIDKIKDYKPDIIGFGALFSSAFFYARMIADKVKEIYPTIPTAVGGIHATIFSEIVLNAIDCFDYVILGEGEMSFLELVQSISHGKSVEFIDGLVYRKNGEVKKNPKNQYIENLDELPFVDFSLINFDEYDVFTDNWYNPENLKIGHPFSIVSSRSCPYKCSFCSVHFINGKIVRYRTPKNIVDEIKYLYENFNANYIQFTDDNLTVNKKRIIDMCNRIVQSNLNIQFESHSGMDVRVLDSEIIDAMVSAGLVRVSFGIENGSPFIRSHVIGKKLSNDKIYEVVGAFAKHKHVRLTAFFIVGFPQESFKSLEETNKMMKELPLDDFGCNFPIPYPGTRLFRECISKGLLEKKEEDYVESTDLFQGSNKPFFKPFNLEIEDLTSFRDSVFRDLNAKRIELGVASNGVFPR